MFLLLQVRLEARELGKIDLSKPNSFLPVHNCDFGQKSKKIIAELEIDSKMKNQLEETKMQFKACFVDICSYLQKQMPHDSTFLRDVTCINPKNKLKATAVSFCARLASTVANCLKNTNFLKNHNIDTYTDLIKMQFRLYQTQTVDMNIEEEKIDLYWTKVGSIKNDNNELIYKELADMVKAVLSISHGNAVPERGFSLNKNLLENRTSLKEETIVALRVVKDSVILHGGVGNFPIDKGLLNSVKNSRAAYQVHLDNAQTEDSEKKKRKAENENNLKLKKQKIDKTDEIKNQLKEERVKLEAAESLIKKGKDEMDKEMSCKNLNKLKIVKAREFMQLGIDQSKTINLKIIELTKSLHE